MSNWDAIAIVILSVSAGYGTFRAVYVYLNELREIAAPEEAK